jgi:uroporphyrinogen decarboxylase
LQCEYPDESVPRPLQYPIKTIEDIHSLKNPDVYISPRTRDRIDGARLFRQRLGDDTPIIGWIEGPLAEACDLVGVSDMLLKLAIEPDFCKLLLEKVTVTAKEFAKAQIENGCQIIGMGDAICSQISPRMYQDYVQDLHQEIIQFIHEQGALVKVHICGNITHLLPYLKKPNPDIVDIDWMVDMDEAYDLLGPDIIRAGNLNPAALLEQGTPSEISQRTTELIQAERGRPFILSGGCEITPLTPAENLSAMSAAARL